jgi:hypothetical protein
MELALQWQQKSTTEEVVEFIVYFLYTKKEDPSRDSYYWYSDSNIC